MYTQLNFLISDDTEVGGVAIAIIPIICRCVVPVDSERHLRFTTATTVTADGMIVGDAELTTLNYTRDGLGVVLDLSGTVLIFTKAGLVPAIEKAKASRIEVVGLGMKGTARVISFDVGNIATLVHPKTGKSTVLYGADR